MKDYEMHLKCAIEHLNNVITNMVPLGLQRRERTKAAALIKNGAPEIDIINVEEIVKEENNAG